METSVKNSWGKWLPMVQNQRRARQDQMNLIDADLEEDPEKQALAALDYSLVSSGSTWRLSDPGSLVPKQAVVAECDGVRYISTEQYGQAEEHLAIWMRSRDTQVGHIPLKSRGLTDYQAAAARLILANKRSCLSGLPGTGKTYTCAAIAESIRSAGMTILGCALTGIAAKRLSDSSGIESTTSHRLLQYDGTSFNAESIDCDTLVVDECSMQIPGLLLAMCSRLPRHAKLVLVGDPNQLPAVMPGECFRDLCDVLPHAHLTEVIRTESDSPIGEAARAILSGHTPVSQPSPSGVGGLWISICDSLVIQDNGKRSKNHPLSIAEMMAEKDDTDLSTIRSMAHSNRTVDILKSQFSQHRRLKCAIPVMCLKNRHDLGIYNGDVGVRCENLLKFGDELVHLRNSEYTEAWFSTVHKMQGQEGRSCQVRVERYMDRRILYTGVTRGKVRVVISTPSMDDLNSVCNNTPTPRTTLLRQLYTGEARIIS